MIAVPNASYYGLSGGSKQWDNPDEFDDTTEAFGVTVTHHLHCVASLKAQLYRYRRGDSLNDHEWEHALHCTEVNIDAHRDIP